MNGLKIMTKEILIDSIKKMKQRILELEEKLQNYQPQLDEDNAEAERINDESKAIEIAIGVAEDLIVKASKAKEALINALKEEEDLKIRADRAMAELDELDLSSLLHKSRDLRKE